MIVNLFFLLEKRHSPARGGSGFWVPVVRQLRAVRYIVCHVTSLDLGAALGPPARTRARFFGVGFSVSSLGISLVCFVRTAHSSASGIGNAEQRLASLPLSVRVAASAKAAAESGPRSMAGWLRGISSKLPRSSRGGTAGSSESRTLV